MLYSYQKGVKILTKCLYDDYIDSSEEILLWRKNNVIDFISKSKSLNYYMEIYKPKYGIRLSTKNFGFENSIKSIPIYATFLIK